MSADRPALSTSTFGPYAARTGIDWDERARGAGWVTAHGSLAKVDLSGFTRLSERLDRSESTGAEVLNAVLNDVFVELIEEILVRGGDVLQFGGDALLVWFEGAGHEVRAVGACRAMQRRLAARPAERTSAGPVRLRMSAGVATGALVLTVVGTDHRELLTLGPTASGVERLEKQAGSGEVLVDLATADALPASVVRRVSEDAWRAEVPRGATLPEPAVPRTPGGDDRAEAFVPPDVRALEAAGVPIAEHRWASVAFIGVTGLDDLVAAGDVPAALDRVEQATRAVEEAVAATQVAWTATDLMADGVVFLLYAGAPVSREDDEERMLRACRMVADRCAGLDVRIGANTGRVFAADIGHPSRRTYAVIGDTTNLAARLMHRADGGTVLVSEDLFARSARDHTVEWLEPFAVKGRRRPVLAGRLGARSGTAARRRTHDLPLVGREDERRRLWGLLDALAGTSEEPGSSLRVAVLAEAGVGKSRLLADVIEQARARHLTVLHAVATAFESDSPYGALREALGETVGLSGEPAPDEDRVRGLTRSQDLLALLNLPLGLDLPTSAQVEAIDPQFLASRRNELVAEVLLAAAGGPMLVVVEDLHVLDRASAGLLDALAARTGPGELAVLVASRTGVGESLEDASLWEVMALEPLDPSRTRELALRALGDGALSDLDLDRLVAESGGNPLFARELVAFTPTASGELPKSAEEVIAARIDTLDPRRRQLLREAATGGPVQRLADLSAVLADPGLADPGAWSPLADFVSVDVTPATVQRAAGPQLRFRHDLYRQSAYAGLAVRRRRALHAAFADHLVERTAGRADAATVAVHLHEAQRYDEAWSWALTGARSARTSGALSDATQLFVRAIDAGRRADVAAEQLALAHEELGDAAELVGRYAEADLAFRTAARVGDGVTRSRRLVKRAAVLERQGRYRLALGLLTRAENLLDGNADEDAVSALEAWTALALRRSSVLHRLGRLGRAYEVAQEVAAVAESGESHVIQGDRARALLRLEMLASEAGRPERFDLGRRALAAFEGLDEDRDLACLLGNVGVTAWEAEDWQEARRRYEESIEVYRRAGDVVGAAIAANNVGEILCEQGELGRAKEVFEMARRVFRAAGHTFGVTCTVSSLGRLAARTGEHAVAERLLQEAHAGFVELGQAAYAVDARLRRLELDLIEHRPGTERTARGLVEELAHLEVGNIMPLTAKRYLAVAIAAAGDLAEARALAEGVRREAVAARVLHEESLALDLLTGLAVLRGEEPDQSAVRRRDELWQQLGIVTAPTYPPVPRAVMPPHDEHHDQRRHHGNVTT